MEFPIPVSTNARIARSIGNSREYSNAGLRQVTAPWMVGYQNDGRTVAVALRFTPNGSPDPAFNGTSALLRILA